MDQFRALSKERAEIEPVVLKAKEYEQAEEDLAAAEEMLSDEEMKEFASEEIKATKESNRADFFRIGNPSASERS